MLREGERMKLSWQTTQKIRKIIHPFKYGFWTILNIQKFKLGMLWEEWDSYAGDGDYGYIPAYTGNRKTTKQMIKWHPDCIFNPRNDDGFVFCLPFFISYILLFIPTLIYDYRCRKSINEQIEFLNTHDFDEEKNEFVERRKVE